MLNSGQKFRALRDKKKYSNSRVLSEEKILNETKNHTPPPPPPPPFKLNGRSLNSEDNILHSTHLFYFLKSLYSIPENLHK